MAAVTGVPRAAAVALAALALALAGCGGDDTSTSSTGASGATGAAGAGQDAKAQAEARTAQTAIETYAVDNGSFEGANLEALAEIAPSLGLADMNVIAERTGYSIAVEAPSGAKYTITSDGNTIDYTCAPPGTGACPESGDWG